MVIRAGVRVAGSGRRANLAEDDHTGGAAVDAQGAPRADVVVDDEHDVVRRVVAGLLGALGTDDRLGLHHVDALPRADVDTAFTHDALGLVNVDELLWLHSLGQIIRIYLDECVLVGVGHHRGVCVGACHGDESF